MPPKPPTLPTPRTIDAIAVGVCLALAGLVFVVGVLPLIEQRREQRQTHHQLAEKHHQIDMLEASVLDMRRRQRELERGLERYPLRLASLDALNRRLAEVTNLAHDAGLELDRVRPGRPVAGEHFQQVPVSVTGQGDYRAVATFLHQARTELPDIALHDLDIQGRPSPDAPTTFSLDLTWYAAPPPSSSASAGQ